MRIVIKDSTPIYILLLWGVLSGLHGILHNAQIEIISSLMLLLSSLVICVQQKIIRQLSEHELLQELYRARNVNPFTTVHQFLASLEHKNENSGK